MSLHGQFALHSLQRIPRSLLHRQYSSSRKIKEYDILFLRQHGVKHAKWHLTDPLRPGARVKLSYGATVPAADLIGRRPLDTVRDSAGNAVVLHEPTLSSYIVNNERNATPIYPHDATTIVSLLDLNPSRPGEEEEDPEGGPETKEESTAPFEIFEAGTGMGSLTLHIARAIHAANPAPPPPLRRLLHSAPFRPHYDFSSSRGCLDVSDQEQFELDAYAASRRFVLHTLDHNPRHARAAYKLVRNFRRAQYLPSIDFHVGSVEGYLSRRLEISAGEPFLSRAVLDLPSAHDHAAPLIQALHTNGLLILFKPSISQIGDFMAWAAATDQPVRLERVIELHTTTVSEGGVQDSAGGRSWDVKLVLPRAQQQQRQGEEGEGKMVQVMRPRVGERVAGGGFVAVLRRWPTATLGQENPSEEAQSQNQ